MRLPCPALPLLALLLTAQLAAGCGPEEPVLQGVPAEPLLGGRPSASAVASTPDQDEAAPYERPAGVHVDVHHLGGRSFRDNRDLLADQLGGLVTVSDLPGGAGQRMDFERGSIQVEDDVVYMLRVPLPEPMRRSQALEALGFPAYVGRYVTLHREYRLNNTWDFRRIRMMRSSTADELVTEVEAWHHVPDEDDPPR